MRGKHRAQPGVILRLLFDQWWEQNHPYPQEAMNVSEQLWEHLATCPTQRLPPSRKNQDLFLSASTRNNANESAVASHYFFNERTKAVLQSHFGWLGRNTLVSSWISCDRIIQHSLKWPAVWVLSPFIYLLETHTHMRAHTHTVVNSSHFQKVIKKKIPKHSFLNILHLGFIENRESKGYGLQNL